IPLQVSSDSLSQGFASWGIGFYSNLYDCFLVTTREQMNQVDWIAGRHDPHEIARDHNVILAGRLSNDAESAEDHAFRLLNPSAGRSAQAHAQQRRICIRK